MIGLDRWQEIFDTLSRNKWRTFLTGFGVFWGIFMLIILLGSGNGLMNAVLMQYEGKATNSLWIWSGETSIPFKGLPVNREVKFNEACFAALKKELNGAEFIVPRNTLSSAFTISANSKFERALVFATTSEYFLIDEQTTFFGRGMNDQDEMMKRKIIYMGARVATNIFGNPQAAIGQYVDVNQVPFKVVGLYDDLGSNYGWHVVYIPFNTFQSTFNRKQTIDLFAVTAKSGVPAAEVERQTRSILSQILSIHPDDHLALGIFNKEEEYKNWMSFFGAIELFLWIIGFGTLAAGIVGVSNIMIISVKERTVELGIRKAVGAKPLQLLVMIVQESLIVTFVSGFLGLACGVFLIKTVREILQNSGGTQFFRNPSIDVQTALWALFFLLLAGILSSVFPAIRAARIKPVEAIQAL